VRAEQGEGPHDPARWWRHAACRGMSLSLFYGPTGPPRESKEDLRAREAAARRVCASCPVMRECLAAELELSSCDQYGVYGGTTERERRKMIVRMVGHGRRLPRRVRMRASSGAGR